jgi:maltose/moltooligosaccharide transporter
MQDNNPYFIKRSLSFWEIWNMSFGFLGIQFGWGLQMANMSSIYENLGAKADDIPGLWLAAPLTGLIVQPIIGYLSDKTWTPLGRRKPFFLIGAILASIMLLIMPHSSTLWMAAGCLWLLDASINISMEPFRAFVSDMLPSEQQTKGYTMQSMFIGLGAIIASALPWIFTNIFHVSTESAVGEIPTNVRWSFYIGAVAFFGAVMYTIMTTKEYPPADMKTFLAERDAAQKEGLLGRIFRGAGEIFEALFAMPKVMRQLSLVQFLTWPGLFLMWFYFGVGTSRTVFKYVDYSDEYNTYYNYMKSQDDLQKAAGNTVALAKIKPYEFPKEMIEKYGSFQKFETAILPVASSTFGTIEAFKAEMSENVKRKKDGTDWGGICFAFYSLVTFLFAIYGLPKMAEVLGKKQTHFICLIIGALGLFSVGFIHDKYQLLISMTGVGIAWASILSMPYAMLVPHLSDRKTGVYVGIFNFFIVLPEILATLCFGWVMNHWLNNDRIHAVMSGGLMLTLAALATLRVQDNTKTN